MGLVFGLALAFWGLGALMGASRRARLAMILSLYLGVVLVHLVMPEGHALRATLGGTPQGWLALGVVGVLVAAYAWGVRRLRARVAPAAAPAVAPERTGTFRPVELDRYARHIVLREIGGPGQKALKQASVLVIGAGGLGAPALMYLAAAGVGRIGVIDGDTVDNSNLQRQVIHTDARIGMAKVFSAQMALEAQNPFVEIRPYNRRLTDDIAEELFADYDLILDGSDNFDTRYLANRAAVAAGKPLIAAAITQWEGQISLYHPAAGGPCYECVFPTRPAPGLAPACAEAGVVAPLPGVMGAMMALEAIKAISGAGEGLKGRMLLYDGLYADTRQIAVNRREDCPVCGG
ncbi:molybdopterin/thiamine biosynthesis adenylyltransferase [Rhodovulum iodosum]|uniref:Molybdopterin/thiamine biosynthesis adenylyltransferase n=1 Tax=Rhodovulum iodosum TaxID=68291 RepID=A0ABV3XSJ1_9RHOB|nr:HesA/MoeB/ThiF family protein [Rhodovulum robiginosum]RSK30604.1 HesA/MoeB/ThiF family protein [Rhodovulum robiginosum]